jgi:uncharacterized SAM-dependent methyltransferase
VHLVDVSAAALEAASRMLVSTDCDRDLAIVTHQASYEAGLEEATREPAGGGRSQNGRSGSGRTGGGRGSGSGAGGTTGRGKSLALFLGSNIGNFDPPGADAFLRSIRAALAAGDALLIGADLVKPRRELLLAYDDPLGVTAAFNRNLLVRVNRELDGDFDVAQFTHRAAWNEAKSRIEMHLVSTRDQRVRVRGARLDVTFRAGETIWTESSYKYAPEGIVQMLQRAGFARAAQWVDERDRFALTLAAAG